MRENPALTLQNEKKEKGVKQFLVFLLFCPAVLLHSSEEPSADASPTNRGPPFVSGYNNGFFIRTEDDNFRLQLNGAFQVVSRHRYLEDGSDDHTTQWKRARLHLESHLFRPWLSARLSLEAADSIEGPLKPQSHLLEAYLQLDASEAASAAPSSLLPDTIRLGAIKTPYGRTFQASDADLAFLDLPDHYMDLVPSWRPGLAVHGRPGTRFLSYNVGFFTPTKRHNDRMVDRGNLFLFMLNLHPFGTPPPPTEGDLTCTNKPALTLGIGTHYNYYTNAAEDKQFGAKAELVFHYRGFSVQSEYFHHKTSKDLSSDTEQSLLVVQAGYFLLPETVSIDARYGEYVYDRGSAGSDLTDREYTIGLSWHFLTKGVKTKLQFDAGVLQQDESGTGGSRRDDERIRAGLMLYF